MNIGDFQSSFCSALYDYEARHRGKRPGAIAVSESVYRSIVECARELRVEKKDSGELEWMGVPVVIGTNIAGNGFYLCEGRIVPHSYEEEKEVSVYASANGFVSVEKFKHKPVHSPFLMLYNDIKSAEELSDSPWEAVQQIKTSAQIIYRRYFKEEECD